MLDFLIFPHVGHFLAQVTPAGTTVTTPEVTPELVQQCLDAMFTPNDTALSCGNLMSQRAAIAWDSIWSQKVGIASPEFIATMNISRYIAGPAVVLWAIEGLRNFARNGMAESWPRFLIIAVMVGILYGNNATVVRNTILMSRSLINYQNGQILELANAGNSYETRFEELNDFGLVEQELIQFREQCNGISVNQEMLECLESADQLAEDAMNDFIERHGTTLFTVRLQRYAKNLIKDPKEFIANTIATGGAVGAGAVVGGPVGAAAVGGVILLGKVANSAVGLASAGILAQTNSIVQHIVEASWLFTAVIVPIPLALAFYSGTRSILVGWVIGFFSLGLFKINLNLASSLIVGMIYERGPGEPVLDLALLSVGVIIMALAMTAGGGMAIFTGLTSAIAGLSLGLLNIASPGNNTAR